jgi:hypothetical protein
MNNNVCKKETRSNSLVYTQDGFIIINIVKQNDWPLNFGIKLKEVNEELVIDKLYERGVAKRLNLFEVGRFFISKIKLS